MGFLSTFIENTKETKINWLPSGFNTIDYSKSNCRNCGSNDYKDNKCKYCGTKH